MVDAIATRFSWQSHPDAIHPIGLEDGGVEATHLAIHLTEAGSVMPEAERRRNTATHRAANLDPHKIRSTGRPDHIRSSLNSREGDSRTAAAQQRERRSESNLLQLTTMALTTISTAAQAVYWLAQLVMAKGR